jgi:hypothetical protein
MIWMSQTPTKKKKEKSTVTVSNSINPNPFQESWAEPCAPPNAPQGVKVHT